VLDIRQLIENFFKLVQDRDIEIYNEFSLQHELGIYLRNTITNYKVQFERNVSFFTNDNKTTKREIDISIFNDDKSEKYAIELKHPLNGVFVNRKIPHIINEKYPTFNKKILLLRIKPILSFL